jgi:hypothetical protein
MKLVSAEGVFIMIPGPERATFIERLAGLFHLPYSIGCLIVSILIGTPGAIILAYLTTGDMGAAVSLTIVLYVGVGTPFWTGVAVLGLLWLLLFYVFYMTRFMRQRLLSTEEGLHPVLPEGEQTFHGAFKLVSKLWPPVVLAIAIIAFYFISSGEYLISVFGAYAVHIANIIYIVIAFPVWFLAFCTFVWVYFGSVYGLYKLGKKPLVLKSSAQDRMLGVKPFGNLSLSLSIVYFFAMVILIMMSLTTAMGSAVTEDIFAFLILMAAFFAIGVVLFMSPLYAVHKKMMEQKENERTLLRRQAYKGVEGKAEPGPQDTVAEMKRKLDSLASMVTLEMAEKSLNSVPNWPIDTPIISRFATIIVSVIAILLAQLILQLLKL